jgi:hypothetical protein
MKFFKLKTLIERIKLNCLIYILTQKPNFFFEQKKPIFLRRKGKLVSTYIFCPPKKRKKEKEKEKQLRKEGFPHGLAIHSHKEEIEINTIELD